VILASAVLLASAIQVNHSDTQVAMGGLALMLGCVGIVFWLREMGRDG
jgi:hypothetical protein